MKCFYDWSVISHQKFCIFLCHMLRFKCNKGMKWPHFTTSLDAVNKHNAGWIFTLFCWNYVILETCIPLQNKEWSKGRTTFVFSYWFWHKSESEKFPLKFVLVNLSRKQKRRKRIKRRERLKTGKLKYVIPAAVPKTNKINKRQLLITS